MKQGKQRQNKKDKEGGVTCSVSLVSGRVLAQCVRVCVRRGGKVDRLMMSSGDI